MGQTVKYTPLPMTKSSSPVCRRRVSDRRICCSLLPATQVAAGLLPLGFCDVVLAEWLPGLLADGKAAGDKWEVMASALHLAPSVSVLLLSPALGVLSERAWDRGGCQGLHKLLAWQGLFWALGAQLLLSSAVGFGMFLGDNVAHGPASLLLSGLGVVLYAVGRAALQVSFHARAAEAVPLPRLSAAFALAALLRQVGEWLALLVTSIRWGQLGYFPDFATHACGVSSACFDTRIGFFAAMLLMLLGCPLAALASVSGDVGRQQRRKQQSHSGESSTRSSSTPRRKQQLHSGASSTGAASTPRALPSQRSDLERASVVEDALREPGARAVLTIAVLAWAGSLALEGCAAHFVAQEVLPGPTGDSALRNGRVQSLYVGMAFSALTPRLLRIFGAFGLLLSGALAQAALLLLAPMVRASAGELLATTWLASFGAARALLLAVPPAIAARRARERSTPVAVAMAIMCTPGPAAQVAWAWAAGPVRGLLGSDVAVLCAGGASSVWAAAVCSYAMACDRDGGRPSLRKAGVKGQPALVLPGLSSRRHLRA
mmetsp:Transcript_13798/g.39471  ORF Transcript_13798/g.39471 Transcript_13798/m.39471 type:complete len:545 (+) Transcript_13798:74-1708(+)